MANIWRDPIFDRTSSDVAFALRQIAAWKKSHSHVGDVKIDNDKVNITAEGETYVADDAVVLQNNARTSVDNHTLVLELGVVYDLKGCLNLSDITRIEDNITYLSERLVKYRYFVDCSSKEWDDKSIPTIQDMKRIGNNIRSLLTVFAKHGRSVDVPNKMLSYEDINALEYNLYLLKQLLDTMVESFYKSGAYKCGSTAHLPIRR